MTDNHIAPLTTPVVYEKEKGLTAFHLILIMIFVTSLIGLVASKNSTSHFSTKEKPEKVTKAFSITTPNSKPNSTPDFDKMDNQAIKPSKKESKSHSKPVPKESIEEQSSRIQTEMMKNMREEMDKRNEVFKKNPFEDAEKNFNSKN